MFYKMIEAKRNEWLASETCTVKAVIDYIVKTGQMRDAQVEAIKTYLFLKIACGCKPLAELFCEVRSIRWIWMIWRYRTAPVNTSK